MASYSLLSGLKVLEVAQLAPSSAGGHLADLGAEVIKVESGPLGDGCRVGGAAAVGGPNGSAFMHLRWNRGKKSVELNLRDEAGKQAFLDLAAECDVVIEGTRAGYLDYLGLGPSTLRATNPRLIFCSISGLGSGGPYSQLGSGGAVFDAFAGLRPATTPEADEPPTTGMTGSTAHPYSMYSLGAYAAMGILAAVIDAQRTGIGQDIEIAGIDVAATWVPDEVDGALNSDKTVLREGWMPDGRLPDWPTLEAYATKDGKAIAFGSHYPKFWRNFCLAIDRRDLLEVDLHSVDEESHDRAITVWRELRAIFNQRTRAEWIDFFREHDIAGGPIYSVDEMVEDPHFKSRQLTYTLQTESGEEIELTGSVVRVKGQDFAPEKAPMVGEDTERVLEDIAGYDDLKIQNLIGTKQTAR